MKYLIVFVTLVKLSVAQYINEEVVKYINKQIDKLLQDNPAKNVLELKINAEFNEERMLLQMAKFNSSLNVMEGGETEAEQAMKRFAAYVGHFLEIKSQLKLALQELDILEHSDHTSWNTKYKALSLKLKLQDSGSVKEAERILKWHQKFKRESSTVDGSATIDSLAEEHRKTLEEMVQLLKELSLYEEAKMKNFLKRVLSNPQQLKILSEALRKIANEYDADGDQNDIDDEDDYDGEGDYFAYIHMGDILDF